ncbi:HEAT repeat domain-containing protein [Actinomadura sp. 6N118]|uniref:HEAT repeat domain-containing protein n=1 Tax=Actinomadura sp. 6N118 TaxID=3375151 RepID=UPI0037916631
MFDGLRRRKVDGLERSRDVAGLAELLRHDRPDMVSRAAEALSRIGGQDAVEALLAALESSHAGTRREIAVKLGEIGDRATADRLAVLLYDEDGRVGEAAARALGRIGGPGALGALVDALVDGDFQGNRAAPRDALRTIMRGHRFSTVRPRQLRHDLAGEVRQLVWAGDFDAARALLRQIADGAASVRTASGLPWGGGSYTTATAQHAAATVQRMEATALRSIAMPDVLPYSMAFEEQELIGQFATLEAFLANLPEDMEEATSPPPANEPGEGWLIEGMIRLLHSRDADCRRDAVGELRGLGGPEAIAALRERLGEENTELRRVILLALNGMDGLDSVAALGDCLTDRHWAIRLAAVAALRKIDGPETVAALHARLDDEHHEVRKAALSIAARTDGEILRKGVQDPHEEVRTRAALVAVDLDDPQWADVLAPLLTEPSRLARAWAAEGLRRWSWAGEPIQLAIAAREWDEVVEAGAAAAEPLMRMLEEIYLDNEPDKEDAMHALERLVTAHGREIPDEVLRAGADFDNFAGPWKSMPDGEDYAPIIDASGLRQACREALQHQ